MAELRKLTLKKREIHMKEIGICNLNTTSPIMNQSYKEREDWKIMKKNQR